MTGTIIISCEHAGNQVPVRFRSLFPEEVLSSHMSWDVGALDMAMAVSEAIESPCFAHQTTRLLVEVDSSLSEARLFSTYSNMLGDEEKQMILDRYYFPYRLRVENAIALSPKPVNHLSIRTFRPASGREMQVARIFFDPQRESEQRAVRVLKETQEKLLPGMLVEFNELSKDHFSRITSYLRRRFSDEEYAGITISVNQNAINTDTEALVLNWLAATTQLL